MSSKDITKKMIWYKFTVESAGVHDMGYEMDHSKRYDGDSDWVAGGVGWELRKSQTADPLHTRTLRDHVVVLFNNLYVSYGVLNALGVTPRALGYKVGKNTPGIRIGTAVFLEFTTELEQEIEERVGYERRSDRERFVQERNAGIWNALLGLVQDHGLPLWRDSH